MYFNPHEREARDVFIFNSFSKTNILIHTSVKLVTDAAQPWCQSEHILIHTSVKLVTRDRRADTGRHEDFNPHEREARDRGVERNG